MEKKREENGFRCFRLALSSVIYLCIHGVCFSGGITVKYRITKRMRLCLLLGSEWFEYASFVLCDEVC